MASSLGTFTERCSEARRSFGLHRRKDTRLFRVSLSQRGNVLKMVAREAEGEGRRERGQTETYRRVSHVPSRLSLRFRYDELIQFFYTLQRLESTSDCSRCRSKCDLRRVSRSPRFFQDSKKRRLASSQWESERTFATEFGGR